MKKIKILESIREGNVGGGETHVLDLCTNLDKERFEPIVLSFTAGPMIDKLKERNIKTKVIHTQRAFDWSVWNEVKTFIQDEKIDIIHAHGTRANSNLFWAAKKLKLPLIYTVHGWSFHIDQNYYVRRIREFSEKFLTAKSDKVICVSKSNEQDGINLFNMKRSTTIHNAINLEKFNSDNKFSDIRKDLGIFPDKTVVGYIVRITEQKDPFTIIRAMKTVISKTDKIVLLMVGDGNLKAAAMELAAELKIENNIIFQPFRSDIPDVLNAIDIYCLPSLWEGFSIGILEAMAMNKAVIASPVDGTQEMIIDGKTGLLIPHGDPTALADAIFKLNDNIELRHGLANNANLFAQNFGIDKLVYEVEKEYANIVIPQITI
jgi:glycosyltransferase involved in cell wall biosynthesis